MFPILNRRVPAIFVYVLCLAISIFAQESRATLTGRVSDPADASVSGANVTITNQQTNIATNVTTGDDGNYTATALQPGRYTVTVEAAGFKQAQSDLVELRTADKATFDVSLEVGNVGETVTVNDVAPLLEADSASRGQVV